MGSGGCHCSGLLDGELKGKPRAAGRLGLSGVRHLHSGELDPLVRSMVAGGLVGC